MGRSRLWTTAAAVALACLASSASGGFPDYVDQDSNATNWHSGISTSDK